MMFFCFFALKSVQLTPLYPRARYEGRAIHRHTRNRFLINIANITILGVSSNLHPQNPRILNFRYHELDLQLQPTCLGVGINYASTD